MTLLVACGRRFFSQVPAWRCVQRTFKAPSCPRKQPQLHTWVCSAFLPCNSAVMGRVMSRPVSTLHCRHLHSTSEDGGPASPKESFSLMTVAKAPKPALYVCFAGLIPFVSAPLIMIAKQSYYPELAFAHMVYGACIVSYFGGARWGFAVPDGSPAKPDWMNLGNSVVPSLVAWLALLCRDNFAEGCLVVIMGLGLSLHYDLILLPGYPDWFKALRTILTLVATFSLVASLIVKKVFPEKKMKLVPDPDFTEQSTSVERND